MLTVRINQETRIKEVKPDREKISVLNLIRLKHVVYKLFGGSI